jgi:hypothetical protein
MLTHDQVYVVLNAGSAVCALLASALWFKASSSISMLPDSWGTSGSAQIKSALEPGLKWNRRATLFAGFSALPMALAIWWNLYGIA